jgi:hypothetical protein
MGNTAMKTTRASSCASRNPRKRMLLTRRKLRKKRPKE